MRIADVTLDEIVVNEGNPRHVDIDIDSSDIKALAETFLDGKPITPPICLMDGGMYRLMDGERRYTAMKRLGTEACQVIVADDVDEAHELMAMLSTNNKLDLTDEQMARGVQQLLLLGVDPVEVSRASGADGKAIGAMSRYVGRKHEKGAKVHQASLDDWSRVSEFDDDPEAQERVVAALDAGELSNVYWRERNKRDVAKRAAKAEKAIAASTATRYTYEEYCELPEKTIYLPGYAPITSSGCGCDGFGATVDESGNVLWFCTKPETHKTEMSPKQLAREKAEREFDVDRKRRKEFFLDMLTGVNATRLTEWMQEVIGREFAYELRLVGGASDDTQLQPTFYNACCCKAFYDADNALFGIQNSAAYAQKFAEMVGTLKSFGYEPSESESALLAKCEKLISANEVEDDGEDDD